MKKIFILMCIALFLTSCGSRLNPEWYPRGAGKDIVYTVGNGKFYLGKTSEGIDLSMFKNDGKTGVIMSFVKKYKKENDNLYIYSDEGYCVINEEKNTAKVWITVDKQHVSNLIGEDNAITYFSSFDAFNENEQNILRKLSNV